MMLESVEGRRFEFACGRIKKGNGEQQELSVRTVLKIVFEPVKCHDNCVVPTLGVVSTRSRQRSSVASRTF